jgi:putative membrane protein
MLLFCCSLDILSGSTERFLIFEKDMDMKRLGILLSASVFFWSIGGARGADPAPLPLDNNLLIKMATCNYAAITISKMAEAQGTSEVKTFASSLVKDHQASYDKLSELLKTRKVGVVSGTEAETKAEIKRLTELKGTDFDREYLKWIIEEHKSSIPLFENQIKLGKDADVTAYAKDNLVVVRKHLQIFQSPRGIRESDSSVAKRDIFPKRQIRKRKEVRMFVGKESKSA